MRHDSLKAMNRDIAPVLDNAEYPRRWKDYIGQEPAVAMARDAATAARILKQPLDHMLVAHPSPGIGKTALVSMVTTELRRPCRVVSGKVTTQKARMILSGMQDRDVLFYDEMHGLGKEEWLLHFMQDQMIIGPRGPEPMPAVTIIGATTYPQKILPAVLDRFMLVAPMQEYNNAEATQITMGHMARTVLGDLPRLRRQEASMLASAGGNNPRAIKKLLVSLRNKTVARSLPLVRGHYDVESLLRASGITPDGLDLGAQRYLEALAVDFQGQAGAKSLEDHLQQPGGLGEVERVLIDKGLVVRTHGGRVLTQDGIQRYRALAG